MEENFYRHMTDEELIAHQQRTDISLVEIMMPFQYRNNILMNRLNNLAEMENKDVDWDEFGKGFGTKVPSESIADKIEPVTPIKGFKVNKIMEKNKYYTPDIEDFYEKGKYYKPTLDELCMGFECEICTPSHTSGYQIEKFELRDSEDFIMDRDGYGVIADIINGFDGFIDKQIRCRYLDKEDIESLGWLYGGKSPEEYLGFNAKVDDTIYHLVIRETHVHINKAVPGERSDMGTSMRNSTLFNGRIKNKSELGRLMKQLDIKIN